MVAVEEVGRPVGVLGELLAVQRHVELFPNAARVFARPEDVIGRFRRRDLHDAFALRVVAVFGGPAVHGRLLVERVPGVGVPAVIGRVPRIVVAPAVDAVVGAVVGEAAGWARTLGDGLRLPVPVNIVGPGQSPVAARRLGRGQAVETVVGVA